MDDVKINVPLNKKELSILIDALKYIDAEWGIEGTDDEELLNRLIYHLKDGFNDTHNS